MKYIPLTERDIFFNVGLSFHLILGWGSDSEGILFIWNV